MKDTNTPIFPPSRWMSLVLRIALPLLVVLLAVGAFAAGKPAYARPSPPSPDTPEVKIFADGQPVQLDGLGIGHAKINGENVLLAKSEDVIVVFDSSFFIQNADGSVQLKDSSLIRSELNVSPLDCLARYPDTEYIAPLKYCASREITTLKGDDASLTVDVITQNNEIYVENGVSRETTVNNQLASVEVLDATQSSPLTVNLLSSPQDSPLHCYGSGHCMR
jgi:hypothetical protein